MLISVCAALLVVATSLTARATPTTVKLLVDGHVVGTAARNPPTTALTRSLPKTAMVRARGVTTVYAVDRGRAAAAVARSTRPIVALPARALSVSIAAPVVAQRLRDNCETAALEVLLATTGIRVDQLTLQRELVKSGPLDPQATPAGAVWGDPDAGYVGRVDGTGSWGGFGVYPGPVTRLAARHGRQLRSLTGASPSALYQSLRDGHAVLAWIGLGDGPYRDWTAPSGKSIRVNLNEHTVALTGLRRDGSLELVNVLRGTREVWTRARFEQAWVLLGRRALATT